MRRSFQEIHIHTFKVSKSQIDLRSGPSLRRDFSYKSNGVTSLHQLLDEKNNKYRWLILSFVILCNLGNFFSDDFPAILENQLKTKLQISALQFNLLYCIQCIPPLALLAGYIVDKLGVYVVMISCSILQNLGQSLCVYGLYQQNYYILLLGRLFFGIGLQNYNICGFNIIDRWFPQQELSFAMGCVVSIGRVSMLISTLIYPKFYDKNKLLWEAAIIGLYVCIFSFFCVLTLNVFDRIFATSKEQQQIQSEKIRFKDIKKFKPIFWLIIITLCIYFMILEPFLANMQEIMILRYSIKHNHASIFYCYPFIFGAIFIPIIGILVDKIGNRGIFAIIGGLLFNFFFIILLQEPDCINNEEEGCYVFIVSALSLIGLGYGILQCVLWPCINLVVRQKNLGTAGGVTNFLLQTGLLINYLLIGIIQDETLEEYGYNILILFCFGESLLITVFAAIFTFYDHQGLRLITDIQPNLALSDIAEDSNSSLQTESIPLIK